MVMMNKICCLFVDIYFNDFQFSNYRFLKKIVGNLVGTICRSNSVAPKIFILLHLKLPIEIKLEISRSFSFAENVSFPYLENKTLSIIN